MKFNDFLILLEDLGIIYTLYTTRIKMNMKKFINRE